MRWIISSGLILLLWLTASCIKLTEADQGKSKSMINIIPKPQKLEIHQGQFLLDARVVIALKSEQAELHEQALYLNDWLDHTAGFRLNIVTDLNQIRKRKAIILDCSLNRETLGTEGYVLLINPDAIELKANTCQGIFYSIQTLRQLLPFGFNAHAGRQKSCPITALSIEDQPRFAWRGMMLDVSRHFFSTDFVKALIDYLALYKLNTFHWHLCDDQGWRIEIKKYPRLTEVGAWRVDREERHWNDRPGQQPGEEATYGGYYTQEEIREIVAYARSRHITIVPEIEMPGHTRAALAAYPQYSCSGGPFTVPPGGYWPITDIYCAGKDSTFLFLQDILSEVMDLFPSEYIHIGGDEADKTNWQQCALCQARIQQQGLADEHELQSYFIKRMEAFIHEKGRKLIGWDEILEGGLAPRATVMSWRGFEGGISAARSGHDVVMSPTSHVYFDYYQGLPDDEPLAIGGFLPLSKVYAFEPVPDSLTANEARHVLGGQANLWTEYIPNPEHAQYMIFPRLAALAEVLWTPKSLRDWHDFARRIEGEMQRYEQRGLNYARSSFRVTFNSSFDAEDRSFRVEMAAELPQLPIHYTLDGRDPTMHSPRYTGLVRLNQSTLIKAAAFRKGERISPVKEQWLHLHKACGKPITLQELPAERYSARGPQTLIDGLRASSSYADGRWLGFHAIDLQAVIDLEHETEIRRLSAGFLNDINAWIFLPVRVTFSLSMDGRHFTPVAEVSNDWPVLSSEKTSREFVGEINPQKARYVKVVAENIKVCPEGHIGAGDKAWLFVDEISVE